MKSVSELRADIAHHRLDALPTPGYYTWWFDVEGMRIILKPLSGVDVSKVARCQIGGKEYYALYFGISGNLLERIKWHVAQPHKPSSVAHGTISTLRHTLGSLLGLPMIASESAVNEFMDRHCVLDYHNCATEDEADRLETNTLRDGYYPLNIAKNVGVPKAIVEQLKRYRKQFGK